MNKKYISSGISLIICLCLAVSAPAKDKSSKLQPKPQEVTLDDIVAKLVKDLELTDSQAAQVKTILADYAAKEKQLKIYEQKQMRKVLTSDQMYSWMDLEREVAQRSKKKHGK